MADDALADLVEAFGHYSDADLQAFLAGADPITATRASFAIDGLTPTERTGFDAPNPVRRESVPPQAAWA